MPPEVLQLGPADGCRNKHRSRAIRATDQPEWSEIEKDAIVVVSARSQVTWITTVVASEEHWSFTELPAPSDRHPLTDWTESATPVQLPDELHVDTCTADTPLHASSRHAPNNTREEEMRMAEERERKRKLEKELNTQSDATQSQGCGRSMEGWRPSGKQRIMPRPPPPATHAVPLATPPTVDRRPWLRKSTRRIHRGGAGKDSALSRSQPHCPGCGWTTSHVQPGPAPRLRVAATALRCVCVWYGSLAPCLPRPLSPCLLAWSLLLLLFVPV